MEVKYNQPIEVSAKAYPILMKHFSGIIAGRVKDGKHYVKCWMMAYKNELSKAITLLKDGQ